MRLFTNNLTSDGYFLSKTARCRRIALAPLPHIGVPPCHGDRGPLVFFWASLYNGNHSLRQEKISCPVNLRGVGNDFSITFLCFQDTTPTFCKRGGSFCIPRKHEKARRSSNPHHDCPSVSPQPLQMNDTMSFRKLKILLPPFPWER